jgi:hypothetical protein
MTRSTVLFIAALWFLIGCGRREPIVYKTIPHGSKPSVVITYQVDQLVSHGNGVYYFKARSDSFGKALSSFIAAHPELEFVSLAPRVSGFDGCQTDGYFVVFRSNANR